MDRENLKVMKQILSIVLIILLSSTCINNVVGQHEGETENDQHDDHGEKHHRITVVMAYSLLNDDLDENSVNIIVVPTVGLNYDYMFHKKWAVGLHTDIVLQQYKVEKHGEDEVLIRDNPVALCAVALFKPLPSLSLIAGYGVELEKHENLQLLRFGVEYGFHLPGNWELGFALEYDQKINTYGSLIFGAGFSKLL